LVLNFVREILEDLFSINILETNWIALPIISAFLFHTLIVGSMMDNDCKLDSAVTLYLSQWNLIQFFTKYQYFGNDDHWTLCFNFVFLIEFYPAFTMKVKFHTIHNIVSVRFIFNLKTQKILFFISLYSFCAIGTGISLFSDWNIFLKYFTQKGELPAVTTTLLLRKANINIYQPFISNVLYVFIIADTNHDYSTMLSHWTDFI